jgi:DNA-binding NarL/FixJ family response regulator
MSGEADRIAVAAVDDEPDVRFLLADALKWSEDMKCVGTFSSGESFLAAAQLIKPEVVMMDIRLPGISGIECARQLKGLFPNVLVIFVTGLADANTMAEALQAGGDDFLTKPFKVSQCLALIRFAVGRRSAKSATPGHASIGELPQLNSLETGVLACIVDGMLNKEIAVELNLSLPTVENVIRQIYEKLHVKNRVGAVKAAIKGSFEG